MVRSTLRSIGGGVIPDTVLTELTLPVSSEHPSFGVSLTAATHIAVAAYLASMSGWHQLVSRILQHSSAPTLSVHATSREAHNLCPSQVCDQDTLTIGEIVKNGGLAQRELTRPVHDRLLGDVPETDLRCPAHRMSLALERAKDWLKCPPCPVLYTHIALRDFQLFF